MTDEHKPLPVVGYTMQPSRTIDAVNKNKCDEERVLRWLDELKSDEAVDQRWLAIGRTQLEKAYMAINRALFKPQRVTLPEDLIDAE